MCITGVLRIVYIYHVYYQTYDVTWAAQGAWAWTGVEAHIAIICSSAPALKVFFNQYLDVTKVTGVLKYSLSRSWHSSGRQDDGTGRSQDTKTGLSAMTTDSLSKSQSTHVDIELGGIGAIPKADIASVYGERPPSISDRVSSNSSQRPLR